MKEIKSRICCHGSCKLRRKTQLARIRWGCWVERATIQRTFTMTDNFWSLVLMLGILFEIFDFLIGIVVGFGIGILIVCERTNQITSGMKSKLNPKTKPPDKANLSGHYSKAFWQLAILSSVVSVSPLFQVFGAREILVLKMKSSTTSQCLFVVGK